MNKCAVIIIYKGDPASMEAQRRAAEALINAVPHIEATSVDTFGLDSDAIAQALVAHVISSHTETKSTAQVENAIRGAIKYIFEQFGDDIRKGPSRFSSNLSYKYIMALIHGNDEALVNAVEILANCKASDIPNDVRTTFGHYNLRQLLDVVQECHTTCAGRIVI